jgi:hypothetical protein
MDLLDAIVRSIQEVSSAKGLNAENIRKRHDRIVWTSRLGILGSVKYTVPLREFERSLEKGMRYVSILIAFADLITKEENKGMIDNIKEAGRRGARTYYSIVPTNEPFVNMTIPLGTGYTTMKVQYEEREDGEYEWTIPEYAELYACIHDHDCPSSLGEAELNRIVSDYAGLGTTASSGVPVLGATQSVRDYSYGTEYDDTDPTIVREHGLTGTYPEHLHQETSE